MGNTDIMEIEPSDIGPEASEDLDIVFYDDGKWRYVASDPDDAGSYRDASVFEVADGGWGLRINSFTGGEHGEGFSRERWPGGLTVGLDDELTSPVGSAMGYETVRRMAEEWVRVGRLDGGTP